VAAINHTSAPCMILRGRSVVVVGSIIFGINPQRHTVGTFAHAQRRCYSALFQLLRLTAGVGGARLALGGGRTTVRVVAIVVVVSVAAISIIVVVVIIDVALERSLNLRRDFVHQDRRQRVFVRLASQVAFVAQEGPQCAPALEVYQLVQRLIKGALMQGVEMEAEMSTQGEQKNVVIE